MFYLLYIYQARRFTSEVKTCILEVPVSSSVLVTDSACWGLAWLSANTQTCIVLLSSRTQRFPSKSLTTQHLHLIGNIVIGLRMFRAFVNEYYLHIACLHNTLQVTTYRSVESTLVGHGLNLSNDTRSYSRIIMHAIALIIQGDTLIYTSNVFQIIIYLPFTRNFLSFDISQALS